MSLEPPSDLHYIHFFWTSKSRSVVTNPHNKQGDEVNPSNPHDIFYNDLSPSASAPYISALKTHSYLTFASTVTVAPWKTVPSTYILCEKDNAIPVPGQDGMIAAAKQVVPESFDVVERCQASHSPFLSVPDWLAEKLIESAK